MFKATHRARKGDIAARQRPLPIDIRTNIEMRAAILALRDLAGMKQRQIADLFDVNSEQVSQMAKRERPIRIRDLTRVAEGVICDACACGNMKAIASIACGECSNARYEKIRAAKIAKLRAWSKKNDKRVPTVTQAASILNIARSYAGEIVMDAFGKDQRIGAQRRSTRYSNV